MGRRIASTGLPSVLSLAGLLLAAPMAVAGEQDQLQLIYSGPTAMVFMPREAAGARPMPTKPVEVTHWTFFDPADRLTSAWGWNTRISRARIDCQAGQSAALNHRVYQDGVFVEESTPPFRMRTPTGEDHQALLAHVCTPADMPPDVVVEDMAAARAWADAAYRTLANQAP